MSINGDVQLKDLFVGAIRHLKQPLWLGLLFAALLVPLFSLTGGGWPDGIFYSAAPVIVLGCFGGPLYASQVRSAKRLPVFSQRSLFTATFAGVWTCLWVIPFNLVIYAKHGHVLPGSESLAYVEALAAAGFLMSFIPASNS